ncbi:MAG: hypothetical protein QOC92_532, partial [Acidimicrobiaceae bacterium]
MVALCMIALLTVLAIVVDLGSTRAIRSGTRSAADSGSTAGAVALAEAANSVAACEDAFAYTFKLLGDSEPSSASISTACSSFSGPCDAAVARPATLPVGSVTVTVTNPVPDDNPLMKATSLGTGLPQTINAPTDGLPCDRVGVEINRPQASVFRGIVGGGSNSFTVHSVALRTSKPGKGEITPALVALNQSACKAIDSGNGLIYVMGNAKGPGIAYSDSDGPSCSSTNPIISGGSAGQVCAQSSSAVGQIGWYQAPISRAYNTSTSVYSNADATCGTPRLNSYRYVGQLAARTERLTRKPIDKVYRCSSVNDEGGQPVCAEADDPVKFLEDLSNSSTSAKPAGFTVHDDCSTSAGITFSVDTWVNCPSFSVRGGIVSITNGATVIFNGSLSVEAGGDLQVNAGTAVGVDEDGDSVPVPLDATKQTKIIINSTAANAFSIQSS